ncbi:FAD-dependent oxidoreductase [Citricoccus muralis]|uniref:FAD-dependent oxidoreductase n=1 Tax=Citricoccus muralis TaxID=169134 RepID=A0ABY8H3Y2_9MICC|nr:FAD-dependent oxidoreductase [Citricoccus muralis]WFP15554.1 FAD-dependent oxidoreductase [Citricoccus muralis]
MTIRGGGSRNGVGASDIPLDPRDPHAERVRATRGLARPEGVRSVAVIGGGIAGLTAAVALAERGVSVHLLEAQAQLGGRVRSWPLEDGRNMSRGFHAFFRQYYNLRALLRRVDPALHQLVPVADYPLRTACGVTDSFAAIPRTPPFNLVGFVWRSPTFPLVALTQVDIATALELIRVEFPQILQEDTGESAADFLDRLRFPDGARHLALEVFARSFFADPREFSARELVTMFHTYFTGSAEGLLFDVPREAYSEALWSPLGEYLDHLGAEVRCQTTVQRLTRLPPGSEAAWRVEYDGGVLDVDAVVLAADPRQARRLVAGVPALAEDGEAAVDEGLRRLQEQVLPRRNAPPFAVLRLWLDTQVAPERPAFMGTSGYELLDNVSVLERYEHTARVWARAHGGSVVELHGYALPAETPVTGDADPGTPEAGPGRRVRDRLVAELHHVYPETRDAGIVAEELLIDDDCGLADTTPWNEQPGVSTGVPGLVLAGDWIRCEYPVALMERAATTGFQAANELLSAWGVTGHDLWSPPLRGLLRRRLRPSRRGPR